MEATETPPIEPDRPGPGLLGGLAAAGTALLLAACSTLGPLPGHVSSTDRTPSRLADPAVDPKAAGRPAGAHRSVARPSREATRLPDQADLSRDATADPPPAFAAGRKARAIAGHRPPAATREALPPVHESRAATGSRAQDTAQTPDESSAALAHIAGAADIADDEAAVLAQAEPLHPTANRPYTVANRRYKPMKSRKPYRQRGMASWYGRAFHGRKTATGERFDMTKMTAAHPTLPLPSWVRVTHTRTGDSVVVRVNDRGPFTDDRIIDLSHAAAEELGFVDDGLVTVEVELLQTGDGIDGKSSD